MCWKVDVKETALLGGDAHAPNILPGKSAASPLVKFIAGLDPEFKMPPKGKPLTPEEIGLVRAWIDAGAVWPDSASVKVRDPLDWWSLKVPVKPPVPSGPANPIDAFLTAKLAEKKLALSPPAGARALCRRLYFDLTGLPPTPEELDAYEAAAKADPNAAYLALVEQLLASPRYGERWARHWLDVVHYGDTHGYDKDQPRPNAWPYRDYVVRAFNEDKPYARFVQEQIAGDMLFPNTRDGFEALGFISAGPWDFIGHAEVVEEKFDGKVARHLDRDDMVGNAIGAFASTTVQCAQCHNHKFDPITQEDYYSLQAVFSALDRADKKYDLDPRVAQRRTDLTARKKELEARDKKLGEEITKAAGPDLPKVEKAIAAAEKSASQGRRPEYGYHSDIAPTQEVKKWVQVDLGKSTPIERVTLAGAWDDFNGIGAGFGFPVRFRVEASDDPKFGGVPIVIAANDLQDFANPGTTPQNFPGGGKAARYVRVTATKLMPRQNDFNFVLAELQVFDPTGKNVAFDAKVSSLDSIEAPVRWARKNLTDGVFPASTGGGEQLVALRKERDALLAKVANSPIIAERAANSAELAKVTKDLAALPAAQVVYAGTVHTGSGTFRGTGGNGGKPRPIYLLARGQVNTPTREVQPGALAALKMLPARFTIPADAPEGARRVALANWLTDAKNPLTWRSIVNRVWQYHFGHGIADTPDDFGKMGALPTHPELLDYLAITFRDDLKGSLKGLHRMIVTSAAYRQASDTKNDHAAQIDTSNTLLWRQNPRKLEAEALRDSILAVSGKLDLKMGGPGWQDFVVKFPEHSPHYKYDLADPQDAKTWRRSIYRFIVRSQTQPMLTSFDCADPSMRVDKRNESVSPAQALALLNNGFVVAQAEHFAKRVQTEAGPDLAAQIERAYRLAVGHAPAPEDRAQLLAFAQKHGMPNLCRVILNLNEFAFVD